MAVAAPFVLGELLRDRLFMKPTALLRCACLALLVSCGGSDGVSPPPAVSTVVVALSSSYIVLGGTTQADATVKDATGTPLLGRTITWSSSSTSVATVDPNGLVTAASGGMATITATSETVSGSATVTVGVASSSDPDATTSYTYQKTDLHISYSGLHGSINDLLLAVAYADFNQDGKTDVIMCPRFTPCELYLNTGSGFQLSPIPGSPGLVYARKALIGDFNSDGKPDVFIVAGLDYVNPSYPGEAPLLLLSSKAGLQKASGLESYVGSHHGAASGDVNGDGNLDIFLTGANPLLLLGQGNGQFSDGSARLPAELQNQNMYTTELRDVDKDGYLDLLVAGHEYDIFRLVDVVGFATRILWGSSTGAFTYASSTVLPAVPYYGQVLDIDVEDIDGDEDRDIVLDRTRTLGEPGPLVTYIEVIKNNGGRQFTNVPENDVQSHSSEYPWIRLQDLNADGFVDILPDDAAHGFSVWNDGTGRFACLNWGICQ